MAVAAHNVISKKNLSQEKFKICDRRVSTMLDKAFGQYTRSIRADTSSRRNTRQTLSELSRYKEGKSGNC